MNLEIRQNLIQTTKLQQKMQMGMSLSNVLEQSREEYWRMIQDLEDSEIFTQLIAYDPESVRISPIRHYFHYSPPPDKRSAHIDQKRSIRVSEDRDAEGIGEDPIGLMESNLRGLDKEIIAKIQRGGIDLFSYYFLNGEGTIAESAAAFELSLDQAKKVHDLVDRTFVLDQTGSDMGSWSSSQPGFKSEIVARVYFRDPDLQVEYFRDNYRYQVNEEKINQFIKKNRISGNRLREIRDLQKKMYLVNSKLDLINRVVDVVVDRQSEFLKTMDVEKLKVLTEKSVAEILGVDPSWVCRLIGGKNLKRYIKCQGKLISLRDFFITRSRLRKKIGMKILKEVLKKRENNNLSSLPDREIVRILKEDYNFLVSRRTLNNWRREIAE